MPIDRKQKGNRKSNQQKQNSVIYTVDKTKINIYQKKQKQSHNLIIIIL